ncbi:MAG: sulfatase [Planctomycetaceae bacterium]|nr:sulfatase [Planctomycetaceae bacterium]
MGTSIPLATSQSNISRRCMLRSAAAGFGYVAFSGLCGQAARASENVLAPKSTHFEPRAKRVLFLHMSGAPSHVDTFDYKPQLQAADGKQIVGSGRLLGSPFNFKQHGDSGLWISDLFPEVAKHADKLCLLRGMHTDQPAHPQATMQMHTGSAQFVRPSLGAWSLYGLGTENESLPGFICISPPRSAVNYGSGFLPAIYQGTPIGSASRGQRGGGGTLELANISNPRLSRTKQKIQLNLIQSLNNAKMRDHRDDSHVEAVIAANELAFRMQDVVPEVMNVNNESSEIQAQYGIGEQATEQFGRQCLLARRFLESGVRFVEIVHNGWDQHTQLREKHTSQSKAVDRPVAGLLQDLADRGLLKDTLVIWGGEFGRTPTAQGTDGRNHNNKGFTMWMAGGGAKGGFSYGATDDLGSEAVVDKMHIHDLHATILHLLGLDHTRLTYRYAGRDFRLTNVRGNVAEEIIA